MKFYELLKDFRKTRAIKQIDLAESVGVTQGYLSGIESGRRKPRSYLLFRIINALRLEKNSAEKLFKLAGIKSRLDPTTDYVLQYSTLPDFVKKTYVTLNNILNDPRLPTTQRESLTNNVISNTKKAYYAILKNLKIRFPRQIMGDYLINDIAQLIRKTQEELPKIYKRYRLDNEIKQHIVKGFSDLETTLQTYIKKKFKA